MPLKFESSALNLHTRIRLTDVDVVIVFVHGFGGSGYLTWGDFPKYMFEQKVARACDVGVFDYCSFLRRKLCTRPPMNDVIDTLAQFLNKLSDRYTHVYLVAHSMGGLISLLAVKRYLDAYDRKTGTIKPIAGAILFGSPLAGSPLSPRIAWLLAREVGLLRRHSPLQREIQEFLSNSVETSNISCWGSRDYQFVLYSGYGDFDFWVKKPSATRGVIAKQCKSFPKNHKELVKPTTSRSSQEIWLSDILNETTEGREKIRFELHARSGVGRLRLPPADVGVNGLRHLVVELSVELDGDELWNACKLALRDAISDQASIVDFDDAGGVDAPDVSFFVVAAANVTGRRADTCQLLDRAQSASDDNNRNVRIVVVGNDASSAKGHIINRLSAGDNQPRAPRVSIGTADDVAELYRQVRTYLARSTQVNSQLSAYDYTDTQAGEARQ